MKRIFIPVSLFLAFYCLSCQKEVNDFDAVIPVPPLPTDSSYLQRYLELDTTSAVIDTVIDIKYTYDLQHRVTKVDFNNWAESFGYITNLQYNATDSLPSAATIYRFDPNVPTAIDTAYQYFSYNGSGQLLSDSTHYASPAVAGYNYEAYRYTYNTGNIQSIFSFEDNNGVLNVEQAVHYLTVSNGNIVAQTDSLDNGLVVTSTMVYDDKPNPFLPYKPKPPVIDMEAHHTDVYQPNNLTQITQLFTQTGSSFTHHYRYIYQYNNQGNPVSASITNVVNPVIDANKSVFIYD